ncbi:MAG: endonuclease III [Chloroflexota bacterium]|nr:endonuclease III [Dehalococcoidia bacterium]MDW8253454.1 endonuclease III [Chloroflexota bacterium]
MPENHLPFDIHDVMRRVQEAVSALPKAVLFELADEGYRSLFEQVVACIISTRTKEEVTGFVVRRLFRAAPTPAAMSALPLATLTALLEPAAFPAQKAAQIQAIARLTVEQFGGALPCDKAIISSLHGVGPKCANLALSIACGIPGIAVDIHVHRITNRWGYVAAKTPEGTLKQLEAVLPSEYWTDINRLLVPFGKYLCTGTRPRCTTCPVRAFCRQIGVSAHR